MAINFSVNDWVVVNTSYVNDVLSDLSISTEAQTLSTLGNLGSGAAQIKEKGNYSTPNGSTLSYVRVVPVNSKNIAYRNGTGVYVFFDSDTQLNNSFELSTAFLKDNITTKCYNSSGSTITKGSLVRQVGFNSTEQLPTINTADASSSSTSLVLGIAAADIANNASGSVILEGSFSGLDTSGYSLGSKVYLSNTAGEISSSSGTETVIIGRVLSVDASDGTISIFSGIALGSDSEGFFSAGAGTNAAIGKGATAPTAAGSNAFAHGDSSSATGNDSFAQGSSVSSVEPYSFAQGKNLKLSGGPSGAQAFFLQGNDIGCNTNTSGASGGACVFLQGQTILPGADSSGPGLESTFIQGQNISRTTTFNHIWKSFLQGQDITPTVANVGLYGTFIQGDVISPAGDLKYSFVQGSGLKPQGTYIFSQGYGTGTYVGTTANASFSQGPSILTDGTYSFSQGGWSIRNSAFAGFAQGMGIYITGSPSVAFAQGWEIGVTSDRSFAQGRYVQVTRDDQKTFGSNRGSTRGAAQSSKLVKWVQTTDATATTLITLDLEEDKAYSIAIRLIGYNSTTDAEAGSFVITQATAYRNAAGAATLPGGPITLTEDTNSTLPVGVTAALSASGNNVILQVTGEAAQTYQWCCEFEFVEVKG